MFGTKSKSLICSFMLMLALTGIFAGGCDDNGDITLSSVKEWIVEVVTNMGDGLYKKGANLYNVIRDVFYEIKIEDGVKFSVDNPLEGQCVEDRIVRIIRDDFGISVELQLKDKKMIRKDEFSPWMIDREALPEEVKQYWNITTI